MTKTKASTELDNPWQDIIALDFDAFMAFFFPKVHQLIDWSRGYEFMDNELQKVVSDAEMKPRLADKLAKVWLKNDPTAALYIHLKVQGQKDKLFEQQIFIDSCRLFERYGPSIISLAILGDAETDWHPKSYSYGLAAGSKMSFRFPTVKLIDYRKKWQTLEKSKNPFAIVVLTHLKGLETRRSAKKRFDEKKELFKALHEANYSEQQILDLFRFMNRVLSLPSRLEQQFNDFATQYKEDRKIPDITSTERLEKEKGIQQTGALQKARDNVVEILKVRFKRVPQSLTKLVQAIEDEQYLSKLHKEAVLIDSLKSFRQLVENPQS
jgi:hypothetical protein